MNAPRIGIVSAIAQEQKGLIDALQGARRVRHGNRDYTLGTLWGREVVLVLCGIGKVAAAATTTSLIVEFGCDALLFTGVAGGLDARVRVGDLVIAETLLQHDLDARPLYPQYEVPDTGRSRFDSDAALTAQLLLAAEALFATGAPSLIESATREAFGLHAPRVHRGLIVSGDRFISTEGESDRLRQALPEALAVEMEGAAVAQVCHDYGVAFAVARTISDRADDTAHLDFGRFIEAVAGPYSLALLSSLWRAKPTDARADPAYR